MDSVVKTYWTYQKPRATKCKEHDLTTTFDEAFFKKNKYEFTQQETTKLFFDIDITHDLAHQIRKDIIKQLDSQKHDYKFVYTDGSTPEKASFHIIFYEKTINKLTFKKEHAKTFLKDFLYEHHDGTLTFEQLFNKYIDNSVYQRKTFLRLPYATDKDKTNPHIPNDVSDMKRYFITYTPIIDPFDYEDVEVKKIIYKGPADLGEFDPVNKAKYTKNLSNLLTLVKKQRFQEYSNWRDLMFLMKGRGLPEEDFIQYSKESEYKDFDENVCRDHWDRCDAKPMLGLTRVIDWCKEDGIDYTFIYTKKEIEDKKKIANKVEEQKKKQEEEQKVTEAYNEYKKNFELTNAKIIASSKFVTKVENEWIIKNQSDMIISYQHLEFDNDNKFIGRWLKDPNIKVYKKIDCIPHTLPQNPAIFNTWLGYPQHEQSDANIQPFLDHIKILCNHEDEVFNYVLHWMAHLIQMPHQKIGTMILFVSEEGAGKGILFETIRGLIGHKNVLDASSVEPVLGHFNGIIRDKILICLNELEFKQSNPVDGKLKALITDPTVSITHKGVDPYDMNSYHRLISFTNKKDLPIQTHSKDRRKLIISSSDELVGNKQYGSDYMKLVNDPKHIGAFYHYLLSLNVSDLMTKALPNTQYHRDVSESQESPVVIWLKDLALTMNQDVIHMSGQEACQSYLQFAKNNNIHYEVSSISLSMKLKNIKCAGVSDTKKGETSNYRVYTKQLIKEHYKL